MMLAKALSPKWTREGRDCPRRGCQGQTVAVTVIRSAHPAHTDPVNLPSIADCLWFSTSTGDTVGAWRCTKCTIRGMIKRHEVK